MRVQVLSPIVVDNVQHNRGEILDVADLSPLQLKSVHVLEDAPAATSPVEPAQITSTKEDN